MLFCCYGRTQQTLQLETDTADMLNEMITSVRKGGRISIVGVYAGFVNHLNIGACRQAATAHSRSSNQTLVARCKSCEAMSQPSIVLHCSFRQVAQL